MSALEKALNHSKKVGIDECEVIKVSKKITTIRITDSEVVEVKQNFDKNYGVRIINKKRIASFQTTDKANIESCISESLKQTAILKPREFWKGLPYKKPNQTLEKTFDKNLHEISSSETTDIAQKMIESAQHMKINTITGSLNIVSEAFELQNSSDLILEDKATYISGIINAESEHGTLSVSGIGQACGRTLAGFSPSEIGNDAKTMCIESINPRKVDSGEYSVIFEPYSVGELLAFVVASNFNLKIFSEKKSCFSNKLEEKIAVDELTLTDDPHAVEGIGSKSHDDEGIPTKKENLIERGVFKNTFSNLFESYKENTHSSGNALRGGSPLGRSSEPIPVSSPHNLKIERGRSSQEEIIKNTKKGLLVGRLWYTYAVNPIKGDFSCTARSGIRIIENGEIKSPGKSVRIIHNLPTMFKNISGIGNNQKKRHPMGIAAVNYTLAKNRKNKRIIHRLTHRC